MTPLAIQTLLDIHVFSSDTEALNLEGVRRLFVDGLIGYRNPDLQRGYFRTSTLFEISYHQKALLGDSWFFSTQRDHRQRAQRVRAPHGVARRLQVRLLSDRGAHGGSAVRLVAL
jgi:hypothetical protein